jgi:hypothetical protein
MSLRKTFYCMHEWGQCWESVPGTKHVQCHRITTSIKVFMFSRRFTAISNTFFVMEIKLDSALLSDGKITGIHYFRNYFHILENMICIPAS